MGPGEASAKLDAHREGRNQPWSKKSVVVVAINRDRGLISFQAAFLLPETIPFISPAPAGR
jgi:hypothetical protein